MLNTKLPEGRWQELKSNELAILYQEAGLRAPAFKALTPEDKIVTERQRRKPTQHQRRGSPPGAGSGGVRSLSKKPRQ